MSTDYDPRNLKNYGMEKVDRCFVGRQYMYVFCVLVVPS